MKNLSLASFACLCFLLFACADPEQEMVNQLDGTWTIQEAVLTSLSSGNDSTLSPPIGTITFEGCKRKKVGNCDGAYELTGHSKITFTYGIDTDSDEVVISPHDHSSEIIISANYVVTGLGSKVMVLSNGAVTIFDFTDVSPSRQYKGRLKLTRK